MKGNIALVGFMATGKTTVGKALAERLGLVFVDTDEMIVKRQDKSIPEIFAEQGEEYFRELEALVLREVCAGWGKVIATGGGAVLKQGNLECLLFGAHVICLTAAPEVVLERTEADVSRPLLASGDRLEKIKNIMCERRDFYAQAEFEVDTGCWDLPAIVADIEGFLWKNGWTGAADGGA